MVMGAVTTPRTVREFYLALLTQPERYVGSYLSPGWEAFLRGEEYRQPVPDPPTYIEPPASVCETLWKTVERWRRQQLYGFGAALYMSAPPLYQPEQTMRIGFRDLYGPGPGPGTEWMKVRIGWDLDLRDSRPRMIRDCQP
jgi:hypothetical protein